MSHSRQLGAQAQQLTLSWLGQLLGFPATWHGHIEDTASISTLRALAAARERAVDDVEVDGVLAERSIWVGPRLS